MAGQKRKKSTRPTDRDGGRRPKASTTTGAAPTPRQRPSDDPYAHLKPHERHLMSELLRLQQYLTDIPNGPDGLPAWTPEEREFLVNAERLHGRSLTEPEKRIWVAQARMIGDL